MFPQIALYLVEICTRHHIKQVVLSAGSRVAPLAVAFVRHTKIQPYTFSDERSAAFVGLGMAKNNLAKYLRQETEQLSPVVLACTSGTASYNYAPAVAEAYYQEVPMLILTADRPPEWIDQQDGQTLRQNGLFAPHIKASYSLPVDTTHPDAMWHAQRMINEAIIEAKTPPYAPVHINIPFREPFYPQQNELLPYPKQVKFFESLHTDKSLKKNEWNTLLTQFERAERVLILVGQHELDPHLLKTLRLLQQDYKITIIGDIVANMHEIPNLIRYADFTLLGADEGLKNSLQADLMISFGQSILSKNLKTFLRAYPARKHWHVQLAGMPVDTFKSLTLHVPVSPNYFFSQLYDDLDFKNMLDLDEEGEENEYYKLWQKADNQAEKKFVQYTSQTNLPFADLQVVAKLMSAIPNQATLHFANSMSVRYANYSPRIASEIVISANRGTSGIDGCTSTALGNALADTSRLVVLLTGDVAFFYDRNALWHNYITPNLRVILLNNGGGNIFRLIEGPNRLPELDEYFETKQTHNAENTAKDAQWQYSKATNEIELEQALLSFFQESTNAKILEIFTNKIQNLEVWQGLKAKFSLNGLQ